MSTELIKDFPLTNNGQCKLFATMSCTALTLMVPIALLLRTAHLKQFAFLFLMPILCLTIIILVVGALFVFLAQWAAYEYRYLRGIREDLQFDSPNQRYVVQKLGKTLTMVENCERWAEEVVPLGLMLSVGVVLALAVLIPF
jgi:hypothetical protein